MMISEQQLRLGFGRGSRMRRRMATVRKRSLPTATRDCGLQRRGDPVLFRYRSETHNHANQALSMAERAGFDRQCAGRIAATQILRRETRTREPAMFTRADGDTCFGSGAVLRRRRSEGKAAQRRFESCGSSETGPTQCRSST